MSTSGCPSKLGLRRRLLISLAYDCSCCLSPHAAGVVLGVDCFNFERVFDEYTTWVGRDYTTGPSGRAINRASSVVDRQESKGTVLIAWERLMQQDLVTAMEISGVLPLTPSTPFAVAY